MSVKLTYTEKGKKPRTEMFRCFGDAQDHLEKLQKVLQIQAASIDIIDKKESALAYLGRSATK